MCVSWPELRQSDLSLMSLELEEALEAWQKGMQAPSVVASTAFAELTAVNACMGMLAGSKPPATTGLDAVMTASKSGLQSVRHAITSSTRHWSKEEGRLRSICVAEQTFGPEIRKIAADFENFSLDDLAKKVAPRVPVWQDALPGGG